MRGSQEHGLLIERSIHYLRKQGYTAFEREKKISVGQNDYFVDILAYKEDKRVPVECGTVTDGTRIPDLLKKFAKVIHIGFSGVATVLTHDMGVWYFICSYNYDQQVEKIEIASKKGNTTFKGEVKQDNYWWEEERLLEGLDESLSSSKRDQGKK